MTSREQFEAWWKTQRAVCQFAREGSKNGAYHSKPCQSAWEAWQSSREALVVELPSLKPSKSGDRYQWADGIYQLKIDVGNMIRAAGIKVKG
ncbi:hypothetical protein Q4997_002602 [Escherichia coli]|uniref:hypothetical protein n=1 Tax=Hafnia paralvei TaxID=546367 RepID=UPI0028E0C68B|nr:hypothetical protein [Escherichia coli]